MASRQASQPSPSSHRLPTVSASQALQSRHARGARTVSTGITQLDKVLSPPSLPGHNVSGGYMRGKVTEVFGPSGVGKTAFGIQAAVSALREGQRVVWVDAACAPLVKHRVDDVLTSRPDAPGASPDELRSHFHYFPVPTLAHLLALFVHVPAAFPPQTTSLVVVDSLATLVDNAYPRNVDDRMPKNKTDQARWAAGRRYTVINDLIAAFTRFAALHDIALLVTSQTITRIRGASRALLVPAISGVEWENGISTRLVLFRDWLRHGKARNKVDANRLQKARFAGLVKANGVALAEEGGLGNVVPFTIDHVRQYITYKASIYQDGLERPLWSSSADAIQIGLCDMNVATDEITTPMFFPTEDRPPKRSFAEVDEDVAVEPNSDELYGWIEDDEVATEGLLMDEAPASEDNAAGPRLDVVAEGHKKKVTRTSVV